MVLLLQHAVSLFNFTASRTGPVARQLTQVIDDDEEDGVTDEGDVDVDVVNGERGGGDSGIGDWGKRW